MDFNEILKTASSLDDLKELALKWNQAIYDDRFYSLMKIDKELLAKSPICKEMLVLFTDFGEDYDEELIDYIEKIPKLSTDNYGFAKYVISLIRDRSS